MATDLTINITLTGAQQATEAVKTIKDELEDATANVTKMQEEFGKFSQPALKAADDAVKLSEKIKDATAAVEAFEPGKTWETFSTATKGALTGLSGIIGAVKLVAGESETMAKVLTEVDAAMAFTEGVSGVMESVKTFQQLKTVAMAALKGIKVGIMETGIGLLLIAVAEIVAHWDDITESVNGVSNKQKENLRLSKEQADAEREKLSHANDQDNILRQQGMSEKEILETKQKQLQVTANAVAAQIESQKAIDKAKERAARENYALLESMINFVRKPIEWVAGQLDKITAGFHIHLNLLKSVKQGLDDAPNAIFHPNQTRKDGEKNREALNQEYTKLQNDIAGNQIAIGNMDKAAEDKKNSDKKEAHEKRLAQQKAHNDQAAQQQQKFNEELRELAQKRNDLEIKDEAEHQKAKLKLQHEAELERIKNLNISEQQKNTLLAETKKLWADQQKAIDDKAAQDAEAAKNKADLDELERVAAEGLVEDEKRKKEQERIAQQAADKEAGEKNDNDISLNLVNAGYTDRLTAINKWEEETTNAVYNNEELKKQITAEAARQKLELEVEMENKKLATISGLLGDGVKLLGKHTAAGKALAIAQAVINTKAGITSALASKAAPFVEPFATITRVASAALIGINGAKAIADIMKTPVPGAAGGGGGAVAMPSLAPPAPVMPTVQTTRLEPDQINQIGNAANGGTVRAFVLESDIDADRSKISRINRAARLGGS